MKLLPTLWVAVACAASGPAGAAADYSHQRAGDTLRFALPAATLGAELARGDETAARQYAAALALSVGVAELLKRSTGIERPDGSNTQSFPSGHAVWTFSPAASVHRRHGLEAALPLYLAASYVGYTRVHARRHRWVDVGAAAVLAAAVSWWLVDPKRSGPQTLQPQTVRIAYAMPL